MSRTAQDSRFAFGENWLSFVSKLDEEQIAESAKSLTQLCGDIRGKTFLDIGSGSGLSSLAAFRLGAKVRSFDFDQQSVDATNKLSGGKWSVEKGSILDDNFVGGLGQYDVVYSWGVLHHTGNMFRAIENAASLVKPDGILAIALYHKTLFCNLWKIEKAIYFASPRIIQKLFASLYMLAFRIGLLAVGRDMKTYIDNYNSKRGMNFAIDVHDWLGGYPYELINPSNVRSILTGLGFHHVKTNLSNVKFGVFGSACDEFVFQNRNI